MYFVKTLFPSIFIWQTLSLSPFALVRRTFEPKYKRIHSVLAFLSMFIHVNLLIYSLFRTKDYIDFSDSSILICIHMTIIIAGRLTAIVILTESCIQGTNQVQLFHQIHQIDEFFSRKLFIDIDHSHMRKFNLTKFFCQT